MKILIIDIDSKIPNLALEKIALYHQRLGDEVIWDMPLIQADKTYVSCVFDWNKYKCAQWEGIAEIGGSGYSLEKTLPPEINAVKPRINLGFTTRGCIRNCPFCIVPKKEGKIRAVADIYDIWDSKAKEIILLDNNILALPEHFKLICSQLRKEKLRVDFNQGLDCRLLTDEICQELFSLKHVYEIRFAFDDIAYKPLVLKALAMLRKNGLKDWQTRWYVYVGTKDTIDTVVERVNILRDNKQLTYLMRDKAVLGLPEYEALMPWCNFPGRFKETTYKDLDMSKKQSQVIGQKELFKDIDQPTESCKTLDRDAFSP